MEQSSEESLESEDSEQNFYGGNDYFKVSKAETFFTPSGDMKISDHDTQGESAKDENRFTQKRANLQEVNEFKNPNGKERGRAKSVGRDVSKSFNPSSKDTKRAVSMPRSELMTKRGSIEKSESPEREKEFTFFSKMSDKQRNEFIREKMGLKPKVVFQDHGDKMSPDYKQRRKSRSRSRSREMDCHRSRKRGREEIKERRSLGDQTYSKRSEDWLLSKDQRYYRDQSRAQRREQKGHNHFRDHGHAERKKEIPCKYFNEAGFCKYSSGHPDLFGNTKLHICAACYYERGDKRLHSQVDCPVVDEACMYFNNFGDCQYKSGHLSLDGKYARHHICKVCFENGEKSFHSAIHCKNKVKKHRIDSPVRERDQSRHDAKYHDEGGHRRNYSKPHDEDRRNDSRHHDEDRRNDSKHHDEKPCSFFNNNGTCKFGSGHFPGSGGFTKQLHICSCCLEFLGEAKDHPASNCSLKKKLSGGRILLVSDEVTELPCNSFNSGNCVLKSGHRLFGETRFVHICKFCFEYRGEQNHHTQEECKLKRKLLQEVKYESQSSNIRKETRDEKPENKITRKTFKERNPTRSTEKSRKHLRGDRLSVNVTPQHEKIVNSEVNRQLKMGNGLKVCLIKAKTCQVAEKSAKVTSYQQPKHVEEAINQTKSYLEDVEHETFLEMKDPNAQGHDLGNSNLEKKVYDEIEQETSTESDEDEEKVKCSNQTKTVLKDKKQESGPQSKEKMHSGDVCVTDQGKVHNPPLLERNPFYHNVNSKSNKEESGKKRRKLERCTPPTVINLTDSSERGANIRESNEKRENSCEEGLLPVDDVLKNSNGQVGNVDSEIEMNESEIMKKIEHLEKLHTIEVEKLRKARHQTAEVAGLAQEFP